MNLGIRWTRRALSRIDAIGTYISANNPRSAAAVMERLHIAALSLRDFPAQGRAGRVGSTRELVLADIPYVIVYRQTANHIEILTIMHSAQQWPKRF